MNRGAVLLGIGLMGFGILFTLGGVLCGFLAIGALIVLWGATR